MAHFGFGPSLSGVVGGDGAWPRKPDPAGLRALMTRFGVRAEATCLVGDSWIDAVTARRGGVAFCWARYGFGANRSAHGATDDAAFVVDDAAQLVRTLLGDRSEREDEHPLGSPGRDPAAGPTRKDR